MLQELKCLRRLLVKQNYDKWHFIYEKAAFKEKQKTKKIQSQIKQGCTDELHSATVFTR